MTEMKIIILQGANDSGKTTSLRKLIEKLTDSTDGNFICQNDKNRFERSKEITVPIVYKGVLIAVSTYGDSAPEMLPSYNNYKDFAQIYVCAAHPYGTPDELVNQWKSVHKDMTFVVKNKTSKENEDLENQATAQQLFEIIDNLV